MGARFADIGARSLMVGATAVVGSLVVGAWVLLRVLRALCVGCFVSPVLDSNPARCRVRLLIGSLELFG